MTYVCNYCGTEHDDSTRSVEHVVPEKLLSRSLVLRDVCGHWNNFFARDFETAVTSSEFVREVLLEFSLPEDRPKKTVYLGEVETARLTKEHRWLVNGEERLRDIPNRRTTDTVTIDAFDDDGQRHPVDVRLPFSITTGLTGDEHAVAGVRERLEKERKRVHDYFTEIARSPEKNADLLEVLTERGLRLKEPKSVHFDEKRAPGSPGGEVTDILPKVYALDRAIWTKFYMKIAWCFACLRLGREQLMHLGGAGVLGHLRSGVVSSETVEQVRSEDPASASAVFRSASINGIEVWMWRGSPVDTEEAISACSPRVRALLSPAHAQRSQGEKMAATWVHFKVPGALDRAGGFPSPEHRHHRLQLRREVAGDDVALVCDIKLFGGAFEATVQLTPRLSPSQLEPAEYVPEVIGF